MDPPAVREIPDSIQRKRDNAINRVTEGLVRTDRPLRIVVIGTQGSGKSSFINSVAAALSPDCWHEYAYTGFQKDGAPITIDVQSYEKCCNSNVEKYRNVPLPTLIDVAGCTRAADERALEELLKLLFYGHIKNESATKEVFEFCQAHNALLTRLRYSWRYKDMRVDRVVFLSSAAEDVPMNLIRCVMNAARPPAGSSIRRSIPVFGVMTKKDKIDEDSSSFQAKRTQFMEALGIHRNRFLLCSNYCDDVDPNDTRHEHRNPEIDIPILTFVSRITDPALKVTHDEEELPELPKLAAQCALVFFACFAFLCFMLPSNSGPLADAVLRACAGNTDGKTREELAQVCKLQPPPSQMWINFRFSVFVVLVCFLYLVFGARVRDTVSRIMSQVMDWCSDVEGTVS